MNYVLFHENCMDGFAAAYVAWLKFGIEAEYIPVNYGQPFPNLPNATNIYILDFSYPRDTLIEVADKIGYDKIVVLDHHKTAQKELEGLSFAHFNMNKSGAIMAWEYFFPNSFIPDLIRYVQDRDLWKWELADSKEVSAYLQLVIDFSDFRKAINKFGSLCNTSIITLGNKGALILEYQNQLIQRMLKTKHQTSLWLTADKDNPASRPTEIKIWSVNSPILQSEIGNELAKEHGMGDVYYSIGDKVRHSLRSVGDVDISVIAKAFGGGGHKNAAGFESN